MDFWTLKGNVRKYILRKEFYQCKIGITTRKGINAYGTVRGIIEWHLIESRHYSIFWFGSIFHWWSALSNITEMSYVARDVHIVHCIVSNIVEAAVVVVQVARDFVATHSTAACPRVVRIVIRGVKWIFGVGESCNQSMHK
uniref:Uncharacterized protein n=1 Tax=Cacopsylla melanoneura TaxID=428564 RepID=A0A8D9EG22_9HEMI